MIFVLGVLLGATIGAAIDDSFAVLLAVTILLIWAVVPFLILSYSLVLGVVYFSVLCLTAWRLR
jgi:hypothetical protein